MDIIELAQECGAHITYIQGSGKQTAEFFMDELQQFAQRIEAPHLHRIAELEKDCDILATNYDAARRASQYTADVADQVLADLKAAEKQIEQLREALLNAKAMGFFIVTNDSSVTHRDLCKAVDKALEGK